LTKTLKLGLIGANIQKTRLPFGLDILSRQKGLDLEFTLHDSKLVDGFDFDGCLAACVAEGYRGTAVTHPFKTMAWDRAARIVDVPGTLGSSNSLLFEKGGWPGSNTDFSGFLKAWLSRMGDARPGRVVIAGAGGVARSIAAGLMQLGAERIDIYDLEAEKALAVAGGADPAGAVVHAIDHGDAGPAVRGADGLVNATPLGMAQYPGMAFERADMGGQKWVFDAVYTPIETKFMIAAAEEGLNRLTGFDLFMHMAMDSFEFFTGETVDRAAATPLLAALAPTD
jgi:shikimate dehydrogenase